MLRYYVLSFYSMFSIVYLNTLIEWMNEWMLFNTTWKQYYSNVSNSNILQILYSLVNFKD